MNNRFYTVKTFVESMERATFDRLPECFQLMNFLINLNIFLTENVGCILISSLFFGDFMDRKANPRLYDEIQDTEGLSTVRHHIFFLSLSLSVVSDSLTANLLIYIQ